MKQYKSRRKYEAVKTNKPYGLTPNRNRCRCVVSDTHLGTEESEL
jgi:hypothetical protein